MSGSLKKKLIVGFSSVITCLAFDSQILLANKEKKLVFDLKINGKEQTRRISTQLLKIDENNQYGQGMTKPLPYGLKKKNGDCPEFARI